MTIRTNARVAGITFLVYIAAGLSTLAYAWSRPAGVLLALIQHFSALVLAVTLYAITRDVDAELAMLVLVCRVAEAVVGVALMSLRLAITTSGATANAPDPAVVSAVAAIASRARSLNEMAGATFFAAGSTIFSSLLLRGRLVPAGLAWLGFGASVLLVICLPLQLGGVLPSAVAQVMWLPMLAFEVPLGIWLIAKGTAGSRTGARQSDVNAEDAENQLSIDSLRTLR